MLWLPTALYDGVPRVGGRFTFVANESSLYSDAPIVIKAGAGKRVLAKILGQERFLDFLEREDTDLSFVAGTSRGASISPNIPFSRPALSSRYLNWDMGEKSETRGSQE